MVVVAVVVVVVVVLVVVVHRSKHTRDGMLLLDPI